MRRRDVFPDRAVGDRGATLPELVIALGLTAMAMAAIMGLISSSSGVVGDISADDPLAGVAIDWVAADLREATGLDVVASDGVDDVTRIEEELVARTVHDHAAPTQSEQELAVVVCVPVGPSPLFELHPVQTHRFVVVAAQEPLHRGRQDEVVRVRGIVGQRRPVDALHARVSELEVSDGPEKAGVIG